MIIKEITFENFRPYRDVCSVVLSSSTEKNVTLINGENGQGKTSFFTGLNWCLYGDSSIPKTVVGERELINKGILYDSGPGEKIKSSVVVKFSRNNDQYIVHRSKTVLKKGKVGTLDYTVIDTDYYIQKIDEGVQKYYGDDAQEILNVILPENVRTYFFFDGERINAFAEAKPEEVGMAVRNVLKLDLITRAKEHLGIVARELQNEARPYISEEMKDLLSKQEELITQRDERVAQKERLKEELAACRNIKGQISNELDSMKEVETQMARRRVLQDQLEDLEDDYKSIRKEMGTVLSGSYRLLAHNHFKNARSIIGKSTADVVRHDSKAIKEIAKKIYETQHCMFCDRDIDKYDKSRLMSLVTAESSTQFEYSDLMNLAHDIDDSIHSQKRMFRDLTDGYRRYQDLTDKIKKLQMDIRQIDSDLLNSPHDSVQHLSQKRDKCIQDEVRLEVTIEELNEQIEELRISINEIVEERKRRTQLQSEAQLKLDQSDLAEKCVQELETVYEVFAEQMRSKIQEETTDIFKALLLKQQQFQRVELDDKYNMSLIDRYGDKNSRIDISAAESQILGLSFILGLAEVSECGAPLVIDTPFGRFSERLKRNVLRQLPTLVPQLILFVTDSEIGSEEHEILNQYVEYEYTLVNDDSTGATSILEGRIL